MTYLLIGVLLVCVGIFAGVCIRLSSDVRHTNELNHRDRVDSRARYLEIINNQRLQYQALVQSYAIQEGKVFVTPVDRVENTRAGQPDPPKHAFKMRPAEPVLSGRPSIGINPDKSGSGKER